MPLETSPESPAPLRQISQLMESYVARLGAVWVEGEIAELTRRQGMCFLTLRDLDARVSMSVTCHRAVLERATTPITEGARVVLHARPDFYVATGRLSLNARDIRPVGIGELLARIEQRRQLLAAEGLFDRALKRPLPFLPHRIGLVTGRGSAAERDVLENARGRWPGVDVQVEYALMQGNAAATQVIEALRRLDADPDVDVIVIARGGGSFEDLLPFSDEALVRAVAAARTPVVSAIGHEPDVPLIDHVADLRASTPTDAAKRVVPAVADEVALLDDLRRRAWQSIEVRVRHDQRALDAVRSRPVMARPTSMIDDHAAVVSQLRERAHRCVGHRLDLAQHQTEAQLARVRALSPLSTLARGYAIAQGPDGHVLTSVDQVGADDAIDLRLVDGHVLATVGATRRSSPVDAPAGRDSPSPGRGASAASDRDPDPDSQES